jgi:hypothetical protein
MAADEVGKSYDEPIGILPGAFLCVWDFRVLAGAPAQSPVGY